MDLEVQSIEELVEGIAVPAGSKLYGVLPGDTVRVNATIEYRGPALSDTFYAAIGHHVVYFDEIWKGEAPVYFADSVGYVEYPLSADIEITEIGLFPWTPGWFDLYVKLKNRPGEGTPELSNVIEVLLKPDFRNFEIISYDKV